MMWKFKHYLIIILLFLVFSFIFSSKFKVNRSIEIPIDISIINKYYYHWFFAFIFIISTIIFIIYRKKSSVKFFLHLIENLKQYLDFLNSFLDKYWINFDSRFKYLSKKQKLINNYYIIIILGLRFVVLIYFIIDIFYFHKLFYFYRTLPLLIIPFIFNIIFYMFKRHIDIQCAIINPKIQPFIFYVNEQTSGIISLKEYVHETSLKLLKKNKKTSRADILLDPAYIYEWETFNKQKIDYKKTVAFFKALIERIILNYIIIYNFENKKSYYDFYSNIIIRSIYFIGWSYICYISDPQMCINIISLLSDTFFKVEEPFSGFFLYKDNNLDSLGNCYSIVADRV